MLQKYNSLFEIDKNKITINNLSEIRRVISHHNKIKDLYSIDIHKINHWINQIRHKEDPKESFERFFSCSYHILPEYFKDLNLHKDVYPTKTELSSDKRYAIYIYEKTKKVLEYILNSDYITEEKNNFIIHNNIYGDINIMPFMIAFCDSSEIIYHKMYRDIHLEKYNQLNLLENFITVSLFESQHNISKQFKESNIALITEIIQNTKELKSQKIAS